MNHKYKKLESFYGFEIQELDVIFSTFSCCTLESSHLAFFLDSRCNFLFVLYCFGCMYCCKCIVVVVVGDINVVF